MPALPPASGVFRAVLQYTIDGQEVRNVLHFSASVGILPIGEVGLATDLEAWWRNNVRAHQSADCVLHHISVQDLGPAQPPAHLRTVASPNNGVSTSGLVPNNVCAVISLRTALAGRSYRGRIYHPGMVLTQVTKSSLASTFITNITPAYNALINPAGSFWSNAKVLGVLSYYHNNAVRETPVFTPVTAIAIDPWVDSQRRRLPGRGR